MDVCQNLSKNIRMLRDLLDKTLEEFSEEVGLSRSTIQDVERGACNPTLKTVEQMADAIGISPIALLSETFDPTEPQAANFILMFLGIAKNLPEENLHQAEALIHQLLIILKPGFEAMRDGK